MIALSTHTPVHYQYSSTCVFGSLFARSGCLACPRCHLDGRDDATDVSQAAKCAFIIQVNGVRHDDSILMYIHAGREPRPCRSFVTPNSAL